MSAKHYTIPGGLYGTQGSYLATARIAMNHTKTRETLALCQEAYQQTNELPSHAKYSMRRRQKQKELHAPLRFGDASEAERIHNATLRDQVCMCVSKVPTRARAHTHTHTQFLKLTDNSSWHRCSRRTASTTTRCTHPSSMPRTARDRLRTLLRVIASTRHPSGWASRWLSRPQGRWAVTRRN